MTLQQKLARFNAAVTLTATDLGLEFVWGWQPERYPADLALGDPEHNIIVTNGRPRGCYSFALAER